MEWWTIDQLEPDTYALSEYGHWEETHCYLLLGTERCLLIDTGLGVSDLGAEVRRLTSLPVLAALTHVHWDHIGGCRHFSQIAVHELERGWLSGGLPIPLEAVKQNLTREPVRFPPDFHEEAYEIYQGEPSVILRDGDTISLGNREIQAIHTPGHSPGHLCFYEPARRALYTGDLIYSGCLYAFYPSTDPAAYLESVKKVGKLPAGRIYPGHHKLEIPVALIKEVEDGLEGLSQAGRLRQGEGLISFPHFQIQL